MRSALTRAAAAAAARLRYACSLQGLPDADVVRVLWVCVMRSVALTGKNQVQILLTYSFFCCLCYSSLCCRRALVMWT